MDHGFDTDRGACMFRCAHLQRGKSPNESFFTMHVSESENDIEANARKKLCASAYAELSDVVCQYEQRGRTLTLRGCVSSFYLKQLAQEAVRNDDIVHHMDNVIEVADG